MKNKEDRIKRLHEACKNIPPARKKGEIILTADLIRSIIHNKYIERNPEMNTKTYFDKEIAEVDCDIKELHDKLTMLLNKRAQVTSPFKVGDIITSDHLHFKNATYKIVEILGKHNTVFGPYSWRARKIKKDGLPSKQVISIEFRFATFRLVEQGE